MRTVTRFAALLIAAATFAACNRETTAADNKPFGAKVQESIDAGKEKLAAAQQEFRAKTDATLKELDANLASVKESAVEASGDARAELDEAVRSLETKRMQLADKLAEWKSVSADKWQTFTADVNRRVADLQRETSQAIEKLE